MSILETEPVKGQANIWFNTQMKTYFIILEPSKDNIPCPAHALIEITHETIEKPVIFEASITKVGVRENREYSAKMIRIPSRHRDSIPKDVKTINYQIQILP